MQPVRSCCQAFTCSGGTSLSAATSMYSPGSVGNRAKLFPLVTGQKESERNAVPSHDATRGVRSTLVDVEASPHGHHDGQKQQGERDAQRAESTAPFVAESILSDQMGERHNPSKPGHARFSARGEPIWLPAFLRNLHCTPGRWFPMG